VTAPTRVQRLVLAAYPPSFRERYGDELAALCEDVGPSPRATFDLALGVLRTWLSPVYPADPAERRRRRLASTAATVWVCWCAVFVGTGATMRMQVDGPPPGFDPQQGGWLVASDAATVAVAIGWVLVVIAGAWIGIPALRHGPREVRRVVLGPICCAVLCVLGIVPFAWYASGHDLSAGNVMPPLWFALGGLAWLLLAMVTCVWGTLAMPKALRLAEPTGERLRPSVLLAAPVSVAMLVPAALLLAVGVRVGLAWGPVVFVVTSVATVVVAAAAVVAVTSVLRSVPSLPAVPQTSTR
jgi:hypothetical protein